MESKELGTNPNALYPNEQIKSICYIKNAITRDNIIVGDYTYYDDKSNYIKSTFRREKE